ncbi:hypothetical protein [Actinomadura rubrisoli]|uniref:SMI1/KNR4 family protein n=1 Tax=Actinomadura rubrisoli TaxID=2530368 RepID=A0A4R5BNQ8_9ACTN|nr:hypothetical protein [Actinomadura rubrisoli]TDD87525.1 hypothetical protein E1298_15960 [Actinomadura rubrisoli]
MLREITRLGGIINERFEPDDRRIDTPLGKRLIPSPVQALLSVEWPEEQLQPHRGGAAFVVHDEDDDYEITFPQLVNGDPIAQDRACLVIAVNESTQRLWVIDLDDEHPDDPWVYEIDHDLYDVGFFNPTRLSQMLATLQTA